MKRIVSGVVALSLIVTVRSASADLLLHYQFEAAGLSGTAPDQTTADSSGIFTSTPGSINALLGYSGNEPGSSYPQLIAGPVKNDTVISKNPDSAMEFFSPNSNSNHTRVQIDAASSGALNDTFENFTVALWLNPSSLSGNRMAIGKMGGSGNRGWQIVSNDGETSLTIGYFDGASGLEREFTVPDVFTVGTWTHVAFTLEGSTNTERVYINGVEQFVSTSGLGAINGLNGADFKVGHRGTTGSGVRSWAGGIDDVRIYDEVLAGTAPGSLTGIGSLLTPVPEPGTIVLASIAWVAGVAVARRRMKRS